MPTERAINRADLIRRLFAVIVSVGFANQLIQMRWVSDGKLPDGTELPHIIYLVLGLFLIIQSWEGYFAALENRPLESITRFYIDLIIVFTYLVLLTVSKGIAAFLLVVCCIFLLYMIWDFLTFKEYHEKYETTDNSLATYLNQIKAAIRHGAPNLRHKLSTIVAFVWFLEVYGTYLQAKNLSPYLYAMAILAGLLTYRSDQATPKHLSFILGPVLIGFAVFIYALL